MIALAAIIIGVWLVIALLVFGFLVYSRSPWVFKAGDKLRGPL